MECRNGYRVKVTQVPCDVHRGDLTPSVFYQTEPANKTLDHQARVVCDLTRSHDVVVGAHSPGPPAETEQRIDLVGAKRRSAQDAINEFLHRWVINGYGLLPTGRGTTIYLVVDAPFAA